jgi:hypothetical protein
MEKVMFLYEKDVYGDKLNVWHDISFEKGDKDSFAYSTKKGTVMYGKNLNEGGFFSAYTTETHYMEFAPKESYKHNSMKEAKESALELLKKLNFCGYITIIKNEGY